uniref:Uncharacterized protein n=1 Tax=Trichuris muris TaxID=70415 RepID=A0A5S6Q7S5_TRIMR
MRAAASLLLIPPLLKFSYEKTTQPYLILTASHVLSKVGVNAMEITDPNCGEDFDFHEFWMKLHNGHATRRILVRSVYRKTQVRPEGGATPKPKPISKEN